MLLMFKLHGGQRSARQDLVVLGEERGEVRIDVGKCRDHRYVVASEQVEEGGCVANRQVLQLVDHEGNSDPLLAPDAPWTILVLAASGSPAEVLFPQRYQLSAGQILPAARPAVATPAESAEVQ